MGRAAAAPASASESTISRRRSHLSASTPPRGESSIVGSIAAASIPANTPAEPVNSSTYIDRANLST